VDFVEQADQRVARVAGGQLGVYTAEYVNSSSCLLDVVPACSTRAQMPFESLDLDSCHYALDVIGDELDGLLAPIRIVPMPQPPPEVAEKALA
jgi:hypothetical protein